MQSTGTKRKHSSIWLHFDEEDEQRAKCKYCKVSLSIAGASNSNLSRHLKMKHPVTPMILERQAPTPESNQINSDPDLVIVNDPSSNNTQIRRQQTQQPNITQFIRRPPPIRKVEQIDRQVLKMIAKGHHALRIVDEPEFKKLIHDVSQCPGYTLPARKTLSKNLLQSTHMEILEKIKIKSCNSSLH